jgi:hypothetical protein
MDIDYLIDRLEALITSGKRVPLSNKVMVDEQECLDLIDQMRAVVPEEIKAAKRTLLDRERILNDADEEARQVLEHAEQEREIMISREGLLAEAERRRDEIISEATQEAYEQRAHAQNLYDEAVAQTQEMREGANNYTMQVLQELDALLGKHLGMVRNGLQSFQQQAQGYQEQIEAYQRQNRPNYAPPAAPPETRLSTTRSTTSSSRVNGTTTTSSNSNAGSASATDRSIAARRPVSNPEPTPIPQKPAISGSSGGTPSATRRVTPPASQTQLPERRTSPGNSGTGTGQNALPSRNFTPVPKPISRSDEDGEDDERHELDDDEFLNPERNNSSVNRRPGLPGSGTIRPNTERPKF